MRYADLFETFTPRQIEYLCRKLIRQMGGDPWEINNGWCMAFASRLHKELPGSEHLSTTTMDGVFPGHSIVRYEGRYYDAESPEGVDDPRDLAYSKRLYAIANGPDDDRE